MREFSVTNLHDNNFDRNIILSLKGHYYLEPLENGIKELMEILIDEQRKFKSDGSSNRGKAIQNLIILNILFGVSVIAFDHVFLDRDYRPPFGKSDESVSSSASLERIESSLSHLIEKYDHLVDSLAATIELEEQPVDSSEQTVVPVH